jgi:hypothetical protein
MRYSTLFIWRELPSGLKVGDEKGVKRCRDEVIGNPEEATLEGMQAKAGEVDEVKRAALAADLEASVSVQAVARGHHTSAVFHAKR